jgi:hypothetical protein
MNDFIEIHQKKCGNFITISLTCIQDVKLSWKAKGLHSYLISRPPGWKIRREDLIRRSTDGKDSVTKALLELKNNYYLYNIQKKSYSGTILSHHYYVLEEPEMDFERLQSLISQKNDEEGKYCLVRRKECQTP